MPHHAAEKKSLRKGRKQNLINNSKEARERNLIKKIRKSVSEGKIQEAQCLIPITISILMKNAKQNNKKKNRASRMTKRLHHLVQSHSR